MERQVMDFNVFIEQDKEGIYVAKVPEIDGCYTQGKTLEEVLERIKEAIEVCLEADKEPIKIPEIALLSEKSLAKDWLSPEDEEAWKDL